ncbi:sigma-70 family RNA polymerase sigma factor [uncultured Pedobacter sp.]|uniref:RNA polymerase sigma factor n=1 Tax=uncultured Pedobacter sp. TaxID=246139 RepID=UPI0025D6DF6A|nr:sigma-70 family RNA polymerase sigma factor [uncultured Pedobacter sp.]
MKPEFSDTVLWSRLLNGEKDALDQIYKAHFQALYQYGMRMLHQEDEVKDCLHNLFVKLWENRKKLNPTTQIRYYLLAALRNTIVNHRTKESKYEKVEANDEYLFDLNFTLESAYIRKEEIHEKTAKLAAAMNQLTPRQKEIIYLKYFEELDYSQIAEIMGLTTKGTYKLSARALDALREIMKVDKTSMVLLLLEFNRLYINGILK